jgi:hypothetical protein
MLPVVALCGCASAPQSNLMPLKVGETWIYRVHGRELDQVVPFKVTRRISVAGTNGYEIASDLGISRLAWVGTKLVADELAGTKYDPPLPLLDSQSAPADAQWEGTVTTPAGILRGTATQSQHVDKRPASGRTGVATVSTIELKTGHNVLTLVSSYVPEVGMIQQEEHNGLLSSTSLTMTSGP